MATLKDFPAEEYTGRVWKTPEGNRFRSDGKNWVRIQEAPKAQVEPLVDIPATQLFGGGLIDQAAQGALFDFYDEIYGAGASAFGDMTYEQARDLKRRELQDFATANPKAAMAAELTGGLGTGLLGAGKVLATKTGKALAENIAKSNLLGRVAKGGGTAAGAGLLTGGVRGAGQAEELSDVPQQAYDTAKQEAVTNAVFGVVGSEAISLAPKFYRWAKTARDPEVKAAQKIEQALSDSGQTAEEISESLAKLGERGVLADIDGVTDLIEIVGQMKGKSNVYINDFLEQRSKITTEKIIPELFGDVPTANQTVNSLKELRRKEAGDMYKKAFQQGIEPTEGLKTIWKSTLLEPELLSAAKTISARQMTRQGEKIDPKIFGDENTMPTLEGWQAIKVAYDDKITKLYNEGNPGVAKEFQIDRDILLRELDDQNDFYKQARNIYSQSMVAEEILKDGKNIFRLSADDFEEMAQDIGKGEREALAIGVVQAIKNKVEKGGWTHDAAKIFRTLDMTRKMKILFDDDKKFNKFMETVDALSRQQATFDAVRGNSATVSRLMKLKELDDNFMDDIVSASVDVATTGGTGSLLRGIQQLAKGLLNKGRTTIGETPTNQTRNLSIAKQLLEQDPVARQTDAIVRQGLLGKKLGGTPRFDISKGKNRLLLPPVLGEIATGYTSADRQREIDEARRRTRMEQGGVVR